MDDVDLMSWDEVVVSIVEFEKVVAKGVFVCQMLKQEWRRWEENKKEVFIGLFFLSMTDTWHTCVDVKCLSSLEVGELIEVEKLVKTWKSMIS